MTLAAGALLLTLMAAGIWTLGARSSSRPLPTYHQLTFDRGLVYAARFAPDGRSIYLLQRQLEWRPGPTLFHAARCS